MFFLYVKKLEVHEKLGELSANAPRGYRPVRGQSTSSAKPSVGLDFRLYDVCVADNWATSTTLNKFISLHTVFISLYVHVMYTYFAVFLLT